MIAENDGLKDTRSIALYDTSISGDEALSLSHYTRIKEVEIDDKSKRLEKYAYGLKNARNDMLIKYNDVDVKSTNS